MVVMMVVHVVQVFLWGAYKYPRELTWLAGTVLFFLTLAMAFSGQVLRWDTDAYWGVGVMVSMAGRVPLVGPQVVETILGGPIIGGETLTRFFALHVFIGPALIAVVLALHLYLVLKLGISAPPVPGERVERATADQAYHQKVAGGEPFFPNALYKDAVFSLLAVLVVFVLAICYGPKGPGDPPDPTLANADPRPDWYFLPLFALMALTPPGLEGFLMVGLPIIAFLVMAAVPFLDNTGERHFSRRPVAVFLVVFLFLSFVGFYWLGVKAPWSPDMVAWSGTPVPVDMVQGRSPVELQGAAVLQNKDCRNCHSLNGQGGHRGPDLTEVAVRLTRDELVRQVVQGGGDMPAYGKQLKPAEVEALVAFLATLHPKDQAPARPADRAPARPGG
jgi:ubiquinol-cytochrome c reductase cytochrome b subunit